MYCSVLLVWLTSFSLSCPFSIQGRQPIVSNFILGKTHTKTQWQWLQFRHLHRSINVFQTWYDDVIILKSDMQMESSNFIKCRFNIVPCQDTCKLICVKLGTMLNAAELDSLSPLWIALCSLKATGLWKSSHSVVKLHEASQMLVMVHYVREMTLKNFCTYGENGSFEHLLFLFSVDEDTDLSHLQM